LKLFLVILFLVNHTLWEVFDMSEQEEVDLSSARITAYRNALIAFLHPDDLRIMYVKFLNVVVALKFFCKVEGVQEAGREYLRLLNAYTHTWFSGVRGAPQLMSKLGDQMGDIIWALLDPSIIPPHVYAAAQERVGQIVLAPRPFSKPKGGEKKE